MTQSTALLGFVIDGANPQATLAGKSHQGATLGYEFIAPNPLRPGRYVVAFGMNQWASPEGWRLHPSRDGVCDYFDFDLQGPAPKLTDAGYFDATVWKSSEVAATYEK